MRLIGLVLLFALVLFPLVRAHAADQAMFGPRQYDVKERYGKENKFQEKFTASDGLYLIKLQSGTKPSERADILGLTLNNETVLRTRPYEYGFFACFVRLRSENTFELLLKDHTPSGFKRPPAVPKNVTVTVMPAMVRLAPVTIGLHAWDDLKTYTEALSRVTAPESSSLAFAALDQGHDAASRAGAVRTLSDRRDPGVQGVLLLVFNDYYDEPDVRGEAALALGIQGDKAVIPRLMRGLLDPEEQIRMGCARALSLYKEEDTRDQLAATLATLDFARTNGIVRTIAAVGWRPVSTLIGLAGSADPDTANLGVQLLSGSRDQRVVELLLRYLSEPGQRDMRLIIAALGETKDSRAIEPLSLLAADPLKSRGLEPALGTALADLGDPRSADLIGAMIMRADSRESFVTLMEAYRKLTGKDFKVPARGAAGPSAPNR